MLSSAQFGRLAHLASYRRSNGVNNPINLLRSLAQKPTVLVPSTPDIEYPMVIPENIVPCGPITPEPGAGVLGDRDPKLGSWLKEAPTVLVNLGTHVEYSQKKVARFGDMVALLLERTDVQVLWKIKREKNSTSSSEDLLSILSTQLASNRLRVVDWIPDLASVLDTGRIVCAVHHGGASSFHESLALVPPFLYFLPSCRST